MKDAFKYIIYAVGVLAVIFGVGAWYYLDGTDAIDPGVYASAEATLKKLDATQAEAKDCSALLREEKSWLDISEEVSGDPSVSAAQKAINKKRSAKVLAQYNVHKPECDPKIAEYERNMALYLSLYKQIKESEVTRYEKIMGKNAKATEPIAFNLKYGLKFSFGSPRFEAPE